MNKYSEEQAARVIQKAVRKRQARNNQATLDSMRHQELQTLRNIHRQRLEAKEREFLYLSKLPAEAVMKLTLKKQQEAATTLQAFWRGRQTRKKLKLENPQLPKKPPKSAPRSFYTKDNFYEPLTKERHEAILKEIRLQGKGDLETYLSTYSGFLDKQVYYEKLRQQRVSDLNESREILRTLKNATTLDAQLLSKVSGPTKSELKKAKKIHKKKMFDPKKWWKNLQHEDEWELEIVGANVIQQIQNYKMDLYRNRQMEFTGQ